MTNNVKPEDVRHPYQRARIYKGWTFKQLQFATGINKSTLRKYEQFRRAPSVESDAAIRAELGCELVRAERELGAVRVRGGEQLDELAAEMGIPASALNRR